MTGCKVAPRLARLVLVQYGCAQRVGAGNTHAYWLISPMY